jgi:hypothetical protein
VSSPPFLSNHPDVSITLACDHLHTTNTARFSFTLLATQLPAHKHCCILRDSIRSLHSVRPLIDLLVDSEASRDKDISFAWIVLRAPSAWCRASNADAMRLISASRLVSLSYWTPAGYASTNFLNHTDCSPLGTLVYPLDSASSSVPQFRTRPPTLVRQRASDLLLSYGGRLIEDARPTRLVPLAILLSAPRLLQRRSQPHSFARKSRSKPHIAGNMVRS